MAHEFRRKREVVVHPFELGIGGVVVVGIDTPLLHIPEEGGEGIEILGGDGIVFVIVALRTASGLTKKGDANRTHAVGCILGKVFLRLRTSLARHQVEAIERGSDALVVGGIG